MKSKPAIFAVIGVLVLALLVAVGVVGYRTAPKTAYPNPIRLDHGVPVGVLDTPGGAIAAADNYLASEDNALLSPARLRAVVNAVWSPRERAVELAQGLPALTLRSGPVGDARLTAAVAADKLDSYTPENAQVAVWHEVTLWSTTPVARQPAQHWMLDTLSLAWTAGRWLVTSRSTAPDGQTPVPSWTNGGPGRTAQAFNAGLAQMSAPYYSDLQGLTP